MRSPQDCQRASLMSSQCLLFAGADGANEERSKVILLMGALGIVGRIQFRQGVVVVLNASFMSTLVLYGVLSVMNRARWPVVATHCRLASK